MANISVKCELVDKFSAAWDRFLHKSDSANRAVEKIEDSISRVEQVTDPATGAVYHWTEAIGHLNKDAMLAVYSFEELVAQGYLIQDVAAKTEELTEDTEELSEEAEDVGEKFEEAGTKAEKSLEKVNKKTSKLGRTLTRLGVMFFGLRAIVSKLRQAMERVPDDIMKPFNKLKTFFSNTLARVMTSFFRGLNPQLEKTNNLLESPAAVNFVKGLQVVFEALGEIAGLAIGMITDLFQEIGQGLSDMGIDIEELTEFIGAAIGAVYVTIHNIVATIYNLFMNLIWTLKKLFAGDFKSALFGLIKTIADFVLDVLSIVAKAIDWIFDGAVSETLMGWKATVDAWCAEQGGWAETEGPKQMETIDYNEYVDKFSAKGREFGSRLKNLGGETLNDIKDSSAQTAGNTKAIKDALTDEDFKMLIDVATQKFVSNVNLTAQTPVITINGANTGKTEADRRALANTIKYILVEQLASGSTTSDYAYAGV